MVWWNPRRGDESARPPEPDPPRLSSDSHSWVKTDREREMVLLQLSGSLHARLDLLLAHLPVELRQRVASHLDQVDDHDPPSPATPAAATSKATIPHEVLVEISQWARARAGNEALEDSGQCSPLLSPPLSCSRSLRPSRQLSTREPVTADRRPCSAVTRTRKGQFSSFSIDLLWAAHPGPQRKTEPMPSSAHTLQSPELLAILAEIQLDQDRRSYSSMTSLSPAGRPSLIPLNDPHTPFGGSTTKSVAEEWTEIKRELGAVVNVTASMLAVATAVWWVGGGRSYAAVRPNPRPTIVPTLAERVLRDCLCTGPPSVQRLGLALTGAIAIAAVEGFLYYRFFTALAAKQARDARQGGVAAELQKARLGSRGGFSTRRGLAGSSTIEDKNGSTTAVTGRLEKRSR